MKNAARSLALLLLFALPAPAGADGAAPPAPWFVNVAPKAGLSGVTAKDGIFTDLDGDGFADLCLDRQRFYFSRDGGKRFEAVDDVGIDFPEVRAVPLDKEGKPDPEHAKEGPFVPQYLHFADLDSDGDQDAIFGVHSSWEVLDQTKMEWVRVPECDPGVRSSIWRNDGKGRFSRGPDSGFTADAAAGPAMALAICDTDLDGNLDLFEGREYRRYGWLFGCGVDRLWRGDGKGGFADVTAASGLMTMPEPGGRFSSRPTYGVTHADYDGDGDQDLLALSYGRQWNCLWRNDGGRGFTEVGWETAFAGDSIVDGRYPPALKRDPEAPFRSNGNTFDCAVGDVDNDGDLDLFLGEIKHWWAGEASDPPSLLVNRGLGGGYGFRRVPVDELLPPRPFRDPEHYNYGDLHVSFADFDNDGRLDLLIGSGDYPDGQFLRLYRQQEDGSFADATELAGFDWEGCGDLSLADYDRDGDVDILAGRSFMRLSKAHRAKYMGGLERNEVGLFRNDVANRSGNHWIVVHLEGDSANRSGIGARVEVTAGGVTQIREIRAGSGLANHQDAPEAHFGLGGAKKIDRIVVRWPDRDRSTTELTDLEPDRHLDIRQSGR